MLVVLRSRRTLRLTSAGRLLPWLGPALRGLIARRFKANVCEFPPIQQDITWIHCRQHEPPREVCPHLRVCPYGQTLEAEPGDASQVFSGQEDGIRPFVLMPEFPLPDRSQPGMQVTVRASFFGREAAQAIGPFWQAVAHAGRANALGDDGIGFTVEPNGTESWRWFDLPRDPLAVSGSLSCLRVELTSPLYLRQGTTEGRRREMLTNPTFGDLFRAGLRTLGGLARGYGQPIDADFTALRQAAEQVPTLRSAWHRFSQGTWSNRRQQYMEPRGVIGTADFGPVPGALVRWMLAAGLAHVGLHRVTGAGGWRILAADEPGSEPLLEFC